LAKVYISPDAELPAPKGPGYIVHYSVERIGGVGPWASRLALNSGHLTAKPSALTRSAQPALGALNDSCVAIASPKGHARPFPEHQYLTISDPPLRPAKLRILLPHPQRRFW